MGEIFLKKNRLFLLASLALAVIFFSACRKETGKSQKVIRVWSWGIAAKALETTIPSFNKIHPDVKVIVENVGRDDIYSKYTIGMASNTGMPDVATIESDRLPGYTENFPDEFWNMLPDAKKYIKDFPESKWTQSMNKDKTIMYSLPWGCGPVAMFYRKDFFQKAGVDPNSIKTWDDYIEAGIKIQKAVPKTKMLAMAYTADDDIFRILMNQLGTFYFNSEGKISINSEKAIRAMSLLKKFKDNNILTNADSWDAKVTSMKNGYTATCVYGFWWGGTMKDQAPELKDKWGIVLMPAFSGDTCRASNLGGSTLVVSSQSKHPKIAYDFVKNAVATIHGQMGMYKKFNLFPAFTPVYDTKDFLTEDDYFSNEVISKLFAETIPKTKPAYYTSDYAEAKIYSTNAVAEVLTAGANPKEALNKAAKAISNMTGRKIEEQK